MSAPTNTMPAKKKIRTSFIAMAFLPLMIMLILNTGATIPAVIIGVIDQKKNGTVDLQDVGGLLGSPAAQTALLIGFIAYAVTAIIIFFIWYKKVFLKHQIKMSNKEVFTLKKVVLAVVLILGTSAVINLGLIALEALAPSVMESYADTMNSVGLGSNLLTTIIYACVLGPVAEELMFRGVTQGYFRRSGINAVAVIFIQAILFGIAHMNVVQSTYATVFGLSLGLLRYKYGNIRITCLAHIVFNIYGTFGVSLLQALELPDAAYYIIDAVLTVAGIVAAVIISKEPATDVDLYKTAPAPAPAAPLETTVKPAQA